MSTSDHSFKSYSLTIRGRLFKLDHCRIMGILNLSPDSFFDGGKYQMEKDVLHQTGKMLEEGADIIDIGAVSTRPGAEVVNPTQEWKRLEAFLPQIRKSFPEAILSVDTRSSHIAKQAASEGIDIINDISAGEDDPDMPQTVAELGLPYIIMHKQGQPSDMQKNPQYDQVVKEVMLFLSKRIYHLNRLGINDIIADPGFGFGKTVEHNYQLLKYLSFFHELEVPLLVGISRKSMINKVLGTKAADSLNGTSVLHSLALLAQPHFLRVHDVKEAKEAVKLVGYYQSIS